MPNLSLFVAVGSAAAVAGAASGAITATATPLGLDALMGTALLPVVDDGTGLGTVYGHPPSLTPGMSLTTPAGPMGFMPSHDRVGLGSPTSSGIFHALPLGGPGGIAGSDVVPPVGATAIDFFMTGEAGSMHLLEITAVGTATSTTIVVPIGAAPTYVGFGAMGETLVDISIVKLPFPSTTMITWNVADIRVLPAPGTAAMLLGFGCVGLRRRG